MEVLDGSTEVVDAFSTEEELGGLALQSTAAVVTASLLVWLSTLVLRAWQRRWSSKDQELHDADSSPVKEDVFHSPPPLTKLQELEHADAYDTDARQAFSKQVEVVDLLTPPSTGSRKAAHARTPPTPRSKPAAPSLSHRLTTAVTATRAWRTLVSLMPRKPVLKKTAAKRQQKIATPAPAAAPSPQGWDPALLAACQQQEANISSLEGLQQSKEFQQHIRSKHGNLDRHMAQVDARLGMYRSLRNMDRTGFLNVLTRQDIQEYDSQPASLWLCILEACVNATVTISLFKHAIAPGGSYTWLAWWLAVQMYGWVKRYPSFVGCTFDMLCVQECAEYPEHSMTASWWRVPVAGMLDLMLPCITFGASAAVSLLLQVCRPWARQTLGQLLLGIRPIREFEYGQVTVPQYQSPTPKIQRPGLTPGAAGYTSAATPASGIKGTALASKFGSPATTLRTVGEPAPSGNTRQDGGLVGVFGSARKRAAPGQTSSMAAASPVPKSPALRHVQPRADGAVLFSLTPAGKTAQRTPGKLGNTTPKVFNDSTNKGFAGFGGASLTEGVPAPSPTPPSAPRLEERSPYQPWTWGSSRRVLPPADLLLASQAQQQDEQLGGSVWGSPGSQY